MSRSPRVARPRSITPTPALIENAMSDAAVYFDSPSPISIDRSIAAVGKERLAAASPLARARARALFSLVLLLLSPSLSLRLFLSLTHRAARCCRSLSWAQVRRALCDEEDGGGGGWRRLRDAHGGLVKPDIVFFGEVGPSVTERKKFY